MQQNITVKNVTVMTCAAKSCKTDYEGVDEATLNRKAADFVSELSELGAGAYAGAGEK